MPLVVGDPIYDTLILRDNANAAITGKTSADFATIEAYQISAPGTTAAVTLTEIGSGKYRISFTPTTVAYWTAHLVYSAGGVFREYEPIQSYDVLPAAADPAAIADAIAAVQSDVTTVKAMTDVATSTRAVAGATVVSASPVTSQGSIEIIQGDAYQSADNRALSFSLTSAPNLTGATVTLVISWGVDSVSVTGTVSNAGGTTQTVAAEFTSVQTALMPITGTTYQLRAVLANTNVVTLKRGRVLVLPPVPAN